MLSLCFTGNAEPTRRRRVSPPSAVVEPNELAHGPKSPLGPQPPSSLDRTISSVKDGRTNGGEIPAEAKEKWNAFSISVNFKDTPINDLVQSLNSLYGVNVVVRKEIAQNVTLHLENIGLVDALLVLCRSNDLSLSYNSGVFYIGPLSEEIRSLMSSNQGRMDLDVQNKEVKQFIREFSSSTGIKILASKDLEGTVSGSWKSVQPLDGFMALMEAHDFKVRTKNDFYIVENREGEESVRNDRMRRSRGSSTGSRLDIEVREDKVTLNLVNANLQDVLIQLAEESNLNTIFYGEFRESINARLNKVSYDEAFSSLLRGTPYTYLLNENGTLLVGAKDPKTESGKILSTYELYRLNHVKADDVFKVLPASINKGLLTVIKEQNAVLISGTRVEIENIKSYLRSVDLEVPQVLLECIIVELTRSKGDEYGIKNNTTEESPSWTGPNLTSYFKYSGDELLKIERKGVTGEIGILPSGFKLELSALESSNKGKVLAMPKVTTLNGNKSSIRVTNTISLAEQAFGPNETPILQYKEFKDGITLNITPFISNGGEITLEIKPEVRTSIQSASGAPTISERSLETTVKLKDSETIILGGLIQNNKKRERQGVPILGSIPLLGYLFSYYKDVENTTELVIFVTPHILSGNSPDVDLENAIDAIENRDEMDSYKEQVNDFKYKPKNPESSATVEATSKTEVLDAPIKANSESNLNSEKSEKKVEPNEKEISNENTPSTISNTKAEIP